MHGHGPAAWRVRDDGAVRVRAGWRSRRAFGRSLLTGAVRDGGAARVRKEWKSRRLFGRGARRAACVYKQWKERTGEDPWD